MIVQVTRVTDHQTAAGSFSGAVEFVGFYKYQYRAAAKITVEHITTGARPRLQQAGCLLPIQLLELLQM